MGSPGHQNLTQPLVADASSYDYFESSTELYFLVRFQSYLPPLLIITGSLGNIAPILALHRPGLAHHSIGLYLSAYLVVSTGYLYAGCGLDWLSHVTGLPNVSHLADWTCRLWKFVFGVVRHSVDWLLVAMVTDRVIATRRALAAYRPVLCTTFVARVAIVGVFVGLTVIAIHAMWIYGLTMDPDGSCGIDERQRDLGSIAWPWLSAVTLSYIPNTLALVLTPLLTVDYLGGLWRSRRRRRRRRDPGAVDDDVEGPAGERNGDAFESVEESIQSGFTLCAICTAFTFLFCTVSANLVNIFWYVNPPDLLTWYTSFATCSMVSCLQSSATFVWCFLCVRNVRSEFRVLLGEICERCSCLIRRVEEVHEEVNIDQDEHP